MNQGVLLAMVADRMLIALWGTAFGFLNLAVGVTLLPASVLVGKLWQEFGLWATFVRDSIFALLAILILLAVQI